MIQKLCHILSLIFGSCAGLLLSFHSAPISSVSQMVDSRPGASLRFRSNCIALTHCCQLHTRLVGPLSPPVGFYIGTPSFKKPVLACSHHVEKHWTDYRTLFLSMQIYKKARLCFWMPHIYL